MGSTHCETQALRLAAVEHIPSVIFASGAGAVLGIAIVRLIEPGLDVSALIGPGTSVPLRIGWLTITAITHIHRRIGTRRLHA